MCCVYLVCVCVVCYSCKVLYYVLSVLHVSHELGVCDMSSINYMSCLCDINYVLTDEWGER